MSSLSKRIAQVFDGLGATGPTWQPSEQQVFRGGDSAVESSEDEKEEGQQVDPLDAGDLLNLDDDSGAAPFEASAQFCRALDREDEFDANDCIADAIDLEEERPERHTQVLPNNAYEPCGDSDDNTCIEASQSFGVGPSSSSGSSVSCIQYPALGDPPLRRSSSPQPVSLSASQSAYDGVDQVQSSREAGTSQTTEQQSRPARAAHMAGNCNVDEGPGVSSEAAGSDANGSRAAAGCDTVSSGGDTANRGISEDKKRVRFAVYQPVQRRGSIEAGAQALMQTSTGLKPARPSIKGQTGSHMRRASTSSVPEHVAHPERFDCYELDAPLIVGGGDRQLAAQGGSTVNITEVTDVSDMDTKDTPQQQPPQQPAETLPQFGAGIEFRPKQKKASAADNAEEAPSNQVDSCKSGKAAAAPVAAQLLAEEGAAQCESEAMDTASDDAVKSDSPGIGINPHPARRRNYRKAAH